MEAHSLPRTGRLFLPRSPKVLAAFSDERLVEQVRRGNEAAFEAVYDRHHRGILSFCRHMLASVEEAEDAVQQTFISAHAGLLSDAREIKLKAWLYTIARNRCLSTLRARREHPAELDDVPTAGLSEEVQQRSDLRDVLADLRRLPVEQRSALVLSELGDLTHAEVGVILGCEVAKVKSLVFQARTSLLESRRAREVPCMEIREQLATATGGALRRGPLRRHLAACEGCSEFRDDVRRQRKALAAILPVIPSLGLKEQALAALGIGGGSGGALIGGGAAGGVVASVASSGAAVKLAAVVAAAGLAVGGGLVLDNKSTDPEAKAAAGQDSGSQAWPAPPAGQGPGAQAMSGKPAKGGKGGPGGATPIAGATPERGRDGAKKKGKRRGARRHGGRGDGKPGRGPDKGGRRHPSHPSTPAPAAPTPSGGGGGGDDGGKHEGGRHGTRGGHRGWEQGRGHENHEQDHDGTHVPGGNTGGDGSADDGAGDDADSGDGGKKGEDDGDKHDGRKGDDEEDDGHGRVLAALTTASPPGS
jgi:RNA polymerase sigma factor (sigma-70 family)